MLALPGRLGPRAVLHLSAARRPCATSLCPPKRTPSPEFTHQPIHSLQYSTLASKSPPVHTASMVSVAIPPKRALLRALHTPFRSRTKSSFVSPSVPFSLYRSGIRYHATTPEKPGIPPPRARMPPTRLMDPLAEERNKSLLWYLVAVIFLLLALSYLSVPFYQLFCQATGYGGAVKEAGDVQADRFKPIDASKTRQISIRFEAQVSEALPWRFEPSQTEIKIVPGETALAFYTATNTLDEPIIGISTYNVTPLKAGQYFNKIQCFCFEEQRLLPHETVEMPVFFYLDPALLEDREMKGVDRITLSYTFFKSLDSDAPK